MTMNDQAARATSDLRRRDDARATDAVSPSLNLDVSKPGNQDTRLPRPVVADADGHELDLGSFPGNTTITCVPWPLITVGQKVWLAVNGTLADGKTTTLPLLTGASVNSSEVRNGLSEALPRSWLEGLSNGSTITLRLDVTLNGSTENADKTQFRTTAYEVLVGGGLEDFETAPLGQFIGQMDRPLCTLQSTHSPGTHSGIEVSPSGGRQLVLTSEQSFQGGVTVLFKPKFTTHTISFDYDATPPAGSSQCYVEINLVDGTIENTVLSGLGRFSSSTAQINDFSVRVRRRGRLSVDNVRFGP